MIKEAQIQREIRRLKKISRIVDFILLVVIFCSLLIIGFEIGVRFQKKQAESVVNECLFVLETVDEYCLDSTEVRIL